MFAEAFGKRSRGNRGNAATRPPRFPPFPQLAPPSRKDLKEPRKSLLVER